MGNVSEHAGVSVSGDLPECVGGVSGFLCVDRVGVSGCVCV